MLSSQSKVYILDDDAQLGEAMLRVLKKQGFDALWVSDESALFEKLEPNSPAVAFIDCLLPNENGVEVAKKIQSQTSFKAVEVVLMSGIFHDSQFIKDAVRSTGAVGFLKKPFLIKEALSFLKKINIRSVPTTTEKSSPRKDLYMLFGKSLVTDREKRKAIEALDELHGYDLPYLFSLLSETKSTGYLNIIDSKSTVSGVSFREGSIISVDVSDESSFLGKLLVQAGFLKPEDLQSALKDVSLHRLGEKLIKANLLSPHALVIAMQDQMSLRLSRIIMDEKYKVNFVKSEVSVNGPCLDSEMISTCLHDWIASQIPVQWLEALYIQWSGHLVIKAPHFDADAGFLKKPLVKNFEGIMEFIFSGKTVADILSSDLFPKVALLKAFHLLVVKGFVAFKFQQNHQDRSLFLQQIMNQFYDKNRFEVFETVKKIAGKLDGQVAEVREEFLKILGEAPIEDQVALSLYDQIKKIVEDSFATETSSDKEQLKQSLAQMELEQKLKASSQYEDAKNKLHKGMSAEALALIERCVRIDPTLSQIKIHLSWARLASKGHGPLREQVLKEAEVDLMQVAPEEKLEAIFHFVMGYYYKTKGDFVMARKSFEKSLNLQNDLIVARREIGLLNSLDVAQAKKTDVLNADLKDLVSNLFRKNPK